jgi:primosomal protein N' (replication factor Y)
VIVQTVEPDATPLRHAVYHVVDGVLAGELERREVLGYPPFRHLVSILVSGPEPGAPLAALRELRARLEGVDAVLLGPAPVLRLRGRHRAQLLAKTTQPRSVARDASALLAAAARTMRRDGLTAVVDVDPQSL